MPTSKKSVKTAAKTVTKNTAKNNTKTVSKTTVKTAVKKPVVHEVEPEHVVDEGVNKEEQPKRFFRLLKQDGQTSGRYCGKKPKQAANKILTAIVKGKKKQKKQTVGPFTFTIVECTRGSKHKTYSYTGGRRKLDKPAIVEKDGKAIEYKFKNYLNKAKKN